MLKEYLVVAQEALNAKKEIYQIKQQRFELAQEEFQHLHRMCEDDSRSYASCEFPAASASRGGVPSRSSAGLSADPRPRSGKAAAKLPVGACRSPVSALESGSAAGLSWSKHLPSASPGPRHCIQWRLTGERACLRGASIEVGKGVNQLQG